MKRIPEPELMVAPEQVRAYAQADFKEPHSNFINLFKKYSPDINPCGLVLDLGCGPGDISFRFAIAFPNTKIRGIDGSEEMVNYANRLLDKKPNLKDRVEFIHSMIQEYRPSEKYDYIISNSLLHHLSDPRVLWDGIKSLSKGSLKVFIMDLLRPESIEKAMCLVEQYVKNEPDILKRDFYKSLLAAFEIDEVKGQLAEASLNFEVEQVSDRHLIVYG